MEKVIFNGVSLKEEENSKINPNSIAELLGFNSGVLETFPDKVYRSVKGEKAIEDIRNEGIVRNAFEAGAKQHSRWGGEFFGVEERKVCTTPFQREHL